MASSLGVHKKDLLVAAERGRESLETLVNADGRDVLNSFEDNIEKVYSMRYVPLPISTRRCGEIANNGIKAHTEIIELAYGLINDRIANINSTNMDALEREFEQIKLDVTVARIAGEQTGLHSKGVEIYSVVSSKLDAIEGILKYKEISDIEKMEKVSEIKEIKSNREAIYFLHGNKIINNGTRASDEMIQKHNDECMSNGMEWDNSSIIDYIKQNLHKLAEQMKGTRFSAFRDILDKAIPKFNPITRRKNLLLPEGRQKEPEPQVSNSKSTNSWDLSNWGMDKEQFMDEHTEHAEEYMERTQITETRQTNEDKDLNI